MDDDFVKPGVLVCNDEVIKAIVEYGKKSISLKGALTTAISRLLIIVNNMTIHLFYCPALHARTVQTFLHGACVQMRDINSPVSNYLDVFDAVLVSANKTINCLAHISVSIIEFGVGFDKFQGTNRRLHRPLSGGIWCFLHFDCPSQNR